MPEPREGCQNSDSTFERGFGRVRRPSAPSRWIRDGVVRLRVRSQLEGRCYVLEVLARARVTETAEGRKNCLVRAFARPGRIVRCFSRSRALPSCCFEAACSGSASRRRQSHLEHVLRIYVEHYNSERPHRRLALHPPQPRAPALPRDGDVRRRDRLGGLVHEYYRVAA
jgi:hypothetical protein